MDIDALYLSHRDEAVDDMSADETGEYMGRVYSSDSKDFKLQGRIDRVKFAHFSDRPVLPNILTHRSFTHSVDD